MCQPITSDIALFSTIFLCTRMGEIWDLVSCTGNQHLLELEIKPSTFWLLYVLFFIASELSHLNNDIAQWHSVICVMFKLRILDITLRFKDANMIILQATGHLSTLLDSRSKTIRLHKENTTITYQLKMLMKQRELKNYFDLSYNSASILWNWPLF